MTKLLTFVMTLLLLSTNASASELSIKCIGKISSLSKSEKLDCIEMFSERINRRIMNYNDDRPLYEPGVNQLLKSLKKTEKIVGSLGFNDFSRSSVD